MQNKKVTTLNSYSLATDQDENNFLTFPDFSKTNSLLKQIKNYITKDLKLC